MSGKTRMTWGRKDTTDGLTIGEAGMVRAREYNASHFVNFGDLSQYQMLMGAFYADSGQLAKGNFWFWDFNNDHSCVGAFSVMR